MKKKLRDFLIVAILATVFILTLSTYAEAVKGKASPIEPSYGDPNIEKYNNALKERKPIFIYIYFPSCKYCQQIDPVINMLEIEWKNKLAFVRFNMANSIYKKYGDEQKITSYPSMHFIRSGRIVKSIVGVSKSSRYEISAELEKLLQQY